MGQVLFLIEDPFSTLHSAQSDVVAGGVSLLPVFLLSRRVLPGPVELVELLERALRPDAETAQMASGSDLQQIDAIHLTKVDP